MALELDHQLAEFFNFLGHQIGLANVWIALSADHGVSSLPDAARSCIFLPPIWERQDLHKQINSAADCRSFRQGIPPIYVTSSTTRSPG